MTSELTTILDKHARWLITGIGERADLQGANLQGANLRGANLEGANLQGANLQGANLWKANLQDADLRGANLQGAHLWKADLQRADLYGADLRGADLREANLQRGILWKANLQDADLRGANFQGAILEKANLILVGHNTYGQLFWGYANEAGVLELRTGHQHFVGIAAARAYWQDDEGDPVLREDSLSLVDRCERMARVRGWKLEPESD